MGRDGVGWSHCNYQNGFSRPRLFSFFNVTGDRWLPHNDS
jgi:hypothetical protein